MRRLRSLLQARRPVLVTCEPDVHVRSAVAAMAQAGAGIVAVLERGELVGVFSERDLMTRVVAAGLSVDETSVGQVMTSAPLTAREDEPIASAVEKMQSRSIRHLPIVSVRGALVDMLSIRDLLGEQLAQHRNDLHDLRSYVSGEYEAGQQGA
jgi:CBS domain-containing protein